MVHHHPEVHHRLLLLGQTEREIPGTRGTLETLEIQGIIGILGTIEIHGIQESQEIAQDFCHIHSRHDSCLFHISSSNISNNIRAEAIFQEGEEIAKAKGAMDTHSRHPG